MCRDNWDFGRKGPSGIGKKAEEGGKSSRFQAPSSKEPPISKQATRLRRHLDEGRLIDDWNL
jgi:hypothetical protein